MRLQVLVSILVLFAAACDEPLEVVVSNGDERVLRIEVELAETADERSSGLRGRSLEPGTGLLIVLPGPADEICIANDGVDIAIDALFIAEGLVTAIERGVAAGDDTDRCHLADHVLEVRASEAESAEVGYAVDLP